MVHPTLRKWCEQQLGNGATCSLSRHRGEQCKARRICGASHLYSLLGALLQREGPEGSFLTFELQWMIFILLAAVLLYPDLIYSHVLSVWIIRHSSKEQSLSILLHWVGNSDAHFATWAAKEIFIHVSLLVILETMISLHSWDLPTPVFSTAYLGWETECKPQYSQPEMWLYSGEM